MGLKGSAIFFAVQLGLEKKHYIPINAGIDFL